MSRLYHAPLGVDSAVFRQVNGYRRTIGVITSGYVSHPSAEAIEEVADAALICKLAVFHLGPRNVEGMAPRKEASWTASLGITDSDLASLYSHAQWVSGLRHVEGFELPVLEGLLCGARPIVFDRPEMRKWYEGHAVFVKESHGEELIKSLVTILSKPPQPVTLFERNFVAKKFQWSRIANGFWEALLTRRSGEL